jgi:hypothetical protein
MEVTFRNVMASAAIACFSLTGTVFAAQDLHSTDTDTDDQQKKWGPRGYTFFIQSFKLQQ